MKIAIIGAGSVGGALGTNWAQKGHDVFFGVREQAQTAHEPREVGRCGLDGCLRFDEQAHVPDGHDIEGLRVQPLEQDHVPFRFGAFVLARYRGRNAH